MEDAVACLRDRPAKKLSELQWNGYKSILAFPSAPTIDGTFLPRHPVEMLKDGDFKKTELLIGSNKNEGKESEMVQICIYIKITIPNAFYLWIMGTVTVWHEYSRNSSLYSVLRFIL